MKSSALIALLFFTTMRAGANTPVVAPAFTERERAIYTATFKRCQPGTTASALNLAFSNENFLDGVDNWIGVATIDPQALQARGDAGLQSPRVAELRRSRGFWLALSDCYGYRYGELNHGLLMKQLVDMGHLSTEVGSAATGLVAAATGARFFVGLFKKFPIASRFVFAGLASLQINSVAQELWKIYGPATEAEKKQFKEVQAQIFSEPDKAIASIVAGAHVKLENIKTELAQPNTTEARKTELRAKRDRILASLEKLKKIQSDQLTQ